MGPGHPAMGGVGRIGEASRRPGCMPGLRAAWGFREVRPANWKLCRGLAVGFFTPWIPAFAGMTVEGRYGVGMVHAMLPWIPAQAGMTVGGRYGIGMVHAMLP